MREEDTELVERIRKIVKRRKDCTEQKMFGGIAFMINGNMCVGPWKGSLVVRLDKAKHEETQALPNVKPMDITGRVMKGWALITPEGIEEDDDLKAWIQRGIKYVKTLPAK